MKETRKCSCGFEFVPKRKAQEYCSPRCRRAAAYGRERFQSETRGPRKRFLRSRGEASDAGHLEAATGPDTPSGVVIVGSFRRHFSSTITVGSAGVFGTPIDILGGQRSGSGLLDAPTRQRILWTEVCAAGSTA